MRVLQYELPISIKNNVSQTFAGMLWSGVKALGSILLLPVLLMAPVRLTPLNIFLYNNLSRKAGINSKSI